MDHIETIILAIFAAPGFWNLLKIVFQRCTKTRDAKTSMLVGLGHDRIVYLGTQYIKRGYITRDEYENLHDYLYVPYTKLGGNGTAKKVMEEVEELPLKG